MTVPDLLSTVLGNSFVKSVLERRLSLWLDLLESVRYRGSEPTEAALSKLLDQKGVSAADSEAILAWGSEIFRELAASDFHSLLEELGERVFRLPVLHLIVAFDPPPSQVELLGLWARKNISSDVLLDLDVDRSIMVGCILTWQGRELDVSLRSRLSDHRPEINALLLSTDADN